MPREAPVMRAVLWQAICLGLLIVDPHIWKLAIWSSRLTSRVFVIGLRRDSVLGSAVRYDLLIKNPMFGVEIPRAKTVNKSKKKPHISPEDFHRLLEFIVEPYATMTYVAVFTGLRVSELVGLN